MPLRPIAAAAALLLLTPWPAASGAPATAGPGASFAARFRLRVTSGGAPEELTEGRVYLFPDGQACVRVERPIRQDVLLSRDRVRFHYPDRALVMDGVVRAGQAPPLLEAIVAGLGTASQLLPGGARLVSRSREPGALRSTWTLPEAAAGGTVEVIEDGDGLRSFELRDAEGQLRRRFDFAGRERVGRLRVPTAVRGDFRARRAPVRTEEWTLSELSEAPPPGVLLACSGEGSASRHEALPW